MSGRPSILLKTIKVGLLAHVDGWPCFFPEDVDPTRMTAPSTGKLLRYLVPSGGYVTEGELRVKPYNRPGVYKAGVFLNSTFSGSYSDAVSLANALPIELFGNICEGSHSRSSQ